MAADRIKGITIQIGGDVKPLNEALESTNKTIATTQKDLKDVQRLLKLDPKNTEMLTQKQQALAKAIEATKEKLKTLKEAERQAQEQFKQGKMSEEQYKALQREIAETEGKLKSLQKTADEATVKLGKGIQSAGEKITDAGKKMSVVSTGIVGLGAAAVKTAADFEAGMSEVAAISGASAEELSALTEEAKRLGAETKFSASDAAEGLKYMAMAGWDTSDMLGGLEGVMKLAAASGEDLGAVSDIVTDALTAFGMKAEESGRFADVLAMAASKSNTNVSMMGETFKYAAPVAGALGYSIEDTATAIGLMANAGIKGEQAGTNLRAILTRLAKPPKAAADAMEALGLSITNADGSIKPLNTTLLELRQKFAGLTQEEQVQMAANLAGQEAMSGLLAIVNASNEDFARLSESINNSAGAVDKMAATMQDNLSGRVEELKSKIEEIAISFGESLIPIVEKAVEKLGQFADWLSQLDEGQRQTIITVGLVVAAIGPLLMIIGQVTQGIGGIISIFPTIKGGFSFLTGTALPAATKGLSTVASTIQGAVTGAFSTLTGTVLPAVSKAFSGMATFIVSNPIVAIVAAVAAAIIAIGVKGDELQALLQKFNDWLQGVFAKDWSEVFGPVLGGILNGFLDTVKGIWDGLKQVFDGIIDFIRGVFTGNWERAWNGIKEIFSGVFDGIASIARSVIGGIESLIDGIGSAIDWVWNKLSNFSFDLPDWDIPFFADGGTLTRGRAIVGEAGPELLTVQNGRAVVQPLTGPHAHPQITQNNYFNNYQPRDGAAAVRDLNRQLGWEY